MATSILSQTIRRINRSSAALANTLRRRRTMARIEAEEERTMERLLDNIAENGAELLPEYSSLVEESLGAWRQIVRSKMAELIANLVAGNRHIEQIGAKSATKQAIKRDRLVTLAECAAYAYGGYTLNLRAIPYTRNELPSSLQSARIGDDGVIRLMNGFKAWLGHVGNHTVLAFAGTEPSEIGSLMTDFQQVVAPNRMYLCAAGLLRILLRETKDKIYITGHSLGGGLTQFAVTANILDGGERIVGVGFNSAGLSIVSLRHLGDERIRAAMPSIFHFVTANDPVSVFGGLIGTRIELPTPEGVSPDHALANLRRAVALYAEKGTWRYRLWRRTSVRQVEDPYNSDFEQWIRTTEEYFNINTAYYFEKYPPLKPMVKAFMVSYFVEHENGKDKLQSANDTSEVALSKQYAEWIVDMLAEIGLIKPTYRKSAENYVERFLEEHKNKIAK